MASMSKGLWNDKLSQFMSFHQVSDDETRTNLNFILDELNVTKNLEKYISDPTEISELIKKGCSIIVAESANNFLLSKFFQVAESILSNRTNVLDDQALMILVEHIICSASFCANMVLYDHLKLLGILLYENGVKCQKIYDSLLGSRGLLIKCAKSRNLDIETKKESIICIGNICVKDSNGLFVPEDCGEIALLTILHVLQIPQQKNVIKIEHCKLINVCLKAIQDILPCIKSQLKHHLGQLLVTIKNYIFYGFPNYDIPFPNYLGSLSSSPRDSSSDMEPDDLSLLQVSLNPVKERPFPARAALKKKARQKRRQKGVDKNSVQHVNTTQKNNGISIDPTKRCVASAQVPNKTRAAIDIPDNAGDQFWRHREPEQSWPVVDSSNSFPVNPVSSSESEFSDSEQSQAHRLRSANVRVRNNSLVCLQTVIKKSERKDLFGFWSSFISDSSEGLSWSLFTIIQNDANTKNRLGAIAVLMDLLDGCKPFLAAADDSDQHNSSFCRSFTPFSYRLASMIYELHRLLDIIATERSDAVKCQLVKCLSLLILNCPYRKLQSGLLTKIFRTIRPLLKEKDDMMLKQSCFVCLSAVLTVDAPLDEVVKNMKNDFSPTVAEISRNVDVPTFSEDSVPWLLAECLRLLENLKREGNNGYVTADEEVLLSLRSEVLLLLIVFVRNYFILLRPFTTQISRTLRDCIKHSSCTIKVNAIKVQQEMSRVMNELMTSKHELKIEICEFWRDLLESGFMDVLQSKDCLETRTKSAACDCLSDIGSQVFEGISLDKGMMIITVLLGLVNDDDGYVRASSIRCLGVFVLYPVLREDVVFVTDTANAAVNGLNDPVLLVRMRAAWALANLSDALVMSKNSGESSSFDCGFSDSLLLHVTNASLEASEDSEKVRCNIVRTLGNVGKYLNMEKMKKDAILDAVENIFVVLSKCILNGQMKTRWNACYAAGNLYSNPCLPNGRTAGSVQLLDALLSVVTSCKNFKVRINAVSALAVPTSRSCYGNEEQFVKVWSCLLHSLSATETISDFSEFRYRDHLRQQICGCLCHITTHINDKDLPNISPIIQSHQEIVIQHLTDYCRNHKSLKEKNSNEQETSSIALNENPFLVAYRYIMSLTSNSALTIRDVYIEVKKRVERFLEEDLKMNEEK